MATDLLGDRMKRYEDAEADRRFMPLLPVLARMDGRAFHSFTKGMERPYDATFSSMMVETTKFLVQESGAGLGYTQSDEISLFWYSSDIKSQIWFDGRITKMVSNLASLTTLRFYQLALERYPKYAARGPTFDARAWQVPSLEEAAHAFLWRELDATKNSISMAARAYYSAHQLDKKNGSQKQEMLFQKGVNWNEYPSFFKRGTYVRQVKVERKFTTEEIANLPPKHRARSEPDFAFERSEIQVLDLPPLTTIPNRAEVLFLGKPWK